MAESEKPFRWTREKILDLITLYKKHEFMWNFTLGDFKNKDKRSAAIQDICRTLDITKDQFTSKIHNLRNQFNFENKKINKRIAASGHTQKVYSKWEYYDNLKFLKRFIAPRPSYISVPHYSPQYEPSNDEKSSHFKIASIDTESFDMEASVAPEEKTDDVIAVIKEVPVSKEEFSLQSEPTPEIDEGQPQSTNNNNAQEIQPPPEKGQSLTIPSISNSGRDPSDIFGEFVANELKGLNSEISRKRLKRRIMQAILDVGNEDDGININIKLT